MNGCGDLYIGTVCLERTRWGRREASFRVSEWLPRFKADGFDGIELWENHFLRADADEQARLVASAAPIAVYNSYVGFADSDAEARVKAAEAIAKLGARAVKYNLGAEAARLDEYRRNLLAWVDALPASCHLLCECHPGTVLEPMESAAAFIAELDPARFGIIVHLSGDPEGVERWFSAMGPRIRHLHLQMRGPETDMTVAANRPPFDAAFDVVKRHGFSGSLTIEFTRGIGKAEEIETLYANACADREYCRGKLQRTLHPECTKKEK